MRFNSRSARISLLALGTYAVVACSKADDTTTVGEAGGTVENPATTTANPNVPGTPTSTSLRVAEVKLGKSVDAVNKTIKDETAEFNPKDTFYASVKTEGAATGATLTTRWTHVDSAKEVGVQNETVTSTGDQHTEFHLINATGWPKGNYRVTVLLNGTEVESKNFTVK
jgi:hypothetical protein